MIFTDYYKASKQTISKHRYDVIEKSGDYPLFETLLRNKARYNVGGLSFYYVPKPASNKSLAQMALTKGSFHISSVFISDLERHNTGYGDIQGTKDALIIMLSNDQCTIELFIARGYKNDSIQLHEEVLAGKLEDEISLLRSQGKTRNPTN